MKSKFTLGLLSALFVLGLASSNAPAQSVFTGFYGQVGVGYENSTPSYSGGTLNKSAYSYTMSGGTTDSFAGTATIGYYFPVSTNFLLGIGAEYSPLSGTKSNATVTLPALGMALQRLITPVMAIKMWLLMHPAQRALKSLMP